MDFFDGILFFTIIYLATRIQKLDQEVGDLQDMLIKPEPEDTSGDLD